jgi:heme oxygenase
MNQQEVLTLSDSSFSGRLREATAQVHDAAERSAFMTGLMSGGVPLSGYVQLIGQYLPIYRALETAGEAMRDDPIAGPFALRELERRSALEADLVSLAGPDWSQHVVATPATQAYVERIEEVCTDWAGGFVAHHYVRYLGDLSGGQIVRRILRRVYDFDDDHGLSFYVFDQIDNSVAVKKRYRQLLDESPWDIDEQERIAAEATLAFDLNVGVFASLEPFGTPSS